MPPQSLKIDHARYVLTLDPQRRIIQDGAILVENGRITRVGKAAELAEARADRVIDGRHLVITPGFFNGHMHISYAHPVRGIFPDEQASPLVHVFNLQTAMTEDEEYHTTLLGLVELVRNGTVCFLDPGSTKFPDACLQAYEDAGIRVVLGECVTDPRSAWEVNTLGTWNVIEACREAGVKRIVYSSSASVYGDAVSTPMTEEHPFNNRTTYGATKIANEQMLRAMYDQHRLPYIAFRYMNIYGPRMDYRGTYVSVIMKVLDKIFAGEPPVIFGDGSQTYDFIYVEDVGRANVLGMKADCADECFNIGVGVGTTINELVERLLRLTGSTLKPTHAPGAASFVTHRVGSTDKARRLIAFEATTSLDEGLRRVVSWRRAHQ